jgi:tetratricopeptide (TPR) repeat protein
VKPKSRYQPGDRIGGRYQVHEVKMGGMGEVYLCHHMESLLPYALKTFQQRYLGDSQRLRQAFEQEVRAWVALGKHPNIVRCHWMQMLDNQPFVGLDWILSEKGLGPDLRSWLRRGPLDLRQALDFVIDSCRGLLHAQQKQPGLVHRDLKPENILMGIGSVGDIGDVGRGNRAKVTDFGLAEIVREAGLELEDEGTAGRQGIVAQKGFAGTPAYAAPEQWRGERLDQRTDIYALGCVLFELVTGEPPFQVVTTPSSPLDREQWLSAMRSLHESAPPPALPTTLPAALDDLLRGCLAKAPTERPADLGELLSQLEDIYRRQFMASPRTLPSSEQFSAAEHVNRGLTYDNLGFYEKALADYGQAIELDPNQVEAYVGRGNTHVDVDQYAAALADYTHAIRLAPNHALAYQNRGYARFKLQLCDEALPDYTRAIELGRNDAEAFVGRGNVLRGLGRYHEALADYSRAVEIDPNHADAYVNRGNIYYDLQQYESALADYTRATELRRNYAEACLNRGKAYFELQRHEEALADFQRAIGLDPDLADAYYSRGRAYSALQRHEEALVDYRRAIELDPSDGWAYVNLGALLGNQGQLHEALECFEEAARLGMPEGAQYAAQVRRMLG